MFTDIYFYSFPGLQLSCISRFPPYHPCIDETMNLSAGERKVNKNMYVIFKLTLHSISSKLSFNNSICLTFPFGISQGF